MARHPKGILFWLEGGREKEAKLVDDRMSISGDSYYWYKIDENLARLKYFVVHHSVTSPTTTPEQIAKMHLARGWDGIGYHFVITNDGVIHYVGDLGTWRANVLNMNDKVIGVNMIGDFRNGKRPTDAQYKAINVLYREFVADGRFPGIKGPASVKFHNELQATACPCDVVKAYVINGLPAAPAPVQVNTPAAVIVKPVENTNPETGTVVPTSPVTGPGTPEVAPEPVAEQEGNKPVVIAEGPEIKLWTSILEFIKTILGIFKK